MKSLGTTNCAVCRHYENKEYDGGPTLVTEDGYTGRGEY